MLRSGRFYYIPLALVLFTGAVMLAGHSALHSKSEVERCLMCASHAELDNSTLVQIQSVPVEVCAQLDAKTYYGQALPGGSLHAFSARAPPTFT